MVSPRRPSVTWRPDKPLQLPGRTRGKPSGKFEGTWRDSCSALKAVPALLDSIRCGILSAAGAGLDLFPTVEDGRAVCTSVYRPEEVAMRMHDLKELTVFPAGDQLVIHVPDGRGEELRLHLASHGIASKVSTAATTPYERLEVEGNVDPVSLQAIIDQWER